MHELGLCDAIVAAVLRQAGGREVSAVRVRVGGHPVDPAVIDQGFRLAALGTCAERARLEVVVDPMTVQCRSCGASTPATDALALVACPRCGGVNVEVTGGETVLLESMTLNDRPPVRVPGRPPT
jgi:hydrogenase nickel incorporation protein HypA/HybF